MCAKRLEPIVKPFLYIFSFSTIYKFLLSTIFIGSRLSGHSVESKRLIHFINLLDFLTYAISRSSAEGQIGIRVSFFRVLGTETFRLEVMRIRIMMRQAMRGKR